MLPPDTQSLQINCLKHFTETPFTDEGHTFAAIIIGTNFTGLDLTESVETGKKGVALQIHHHRARYYQTRHTLTVFPFASAFPRKLSF